MREKLTLWHHIPGKPKFRQWCAWTASLRPSTWWSGCRPLRTRHRRTWRPDIVSTGRWPCRGSRRCCLKQEKLKLFKLSAHIKILFCVWPKLKKYTLVNSNLNSSIKKDEWINNLFTKYFIFAQSYEKFQESVLWSFHFNTENFRLEERLLEHLLERLPTVFLLCWLNTVIAPSKKCYAKVFFAWTNFKRQIFRQILSRDSKPGPLKY